MKKNLICFILLLCACCAQAQKKKPIKDRLYVNFGFGPSYSLYYKGGGWVRDWGTANINNRRESKNVWGYSHFAEAEWRFRNPRWSIRAGYSLHYFAPRYQIEGFTGNGTYYDFDTKETDRNLYPHVSVQYALLTGKNRLEIGTGFYNQIKKQTKNQYYERVVTGSNPNAVTAFLIQEIQSVEAGFPVNLDYMHFLTNGNAIGARLNYNYTQSMRRAEHIALQLFFKANLK